MTMLDPDMPAQQMRLHMGEMTAQEMRTARAAIRWANSALSTITPAEVGGLWAPANPEHAKLGWSYDFEQTERISNAAYKSTGYDATMEVVEFVMAEADRRHRDALTTERAAHAETRQERDEAHDREMSAVIGETEATKRAEAYCAQRDEALKALEPFTDIADLIDIETEGMSETDELALHFHDYLMASWPVALFRAARRVREGGKVDG